MSANVIRKGEGGGTSNQLVSQGTAGSVFSTVKSTFDTGTIEPSGTQRIRKGK